MVDDHAWLRLMKRQIFQIAAILLVIEGAAIGAYLLWGVDRTGELAIISNPPGARVLLNLEPTTYMTDTLITRLPEGNYSVTLEKRGYAVEPFVQVVHLQRNQTSAVAFDLIPSSEPMAYTPPTVQETPKTRPEYQPTFPIPITSKSTTADSIGRAQNRKTQKQDTGGTPAPLTQRSQSEFGSVDVASNMVGADIYLDGNPTGQKTNATMMVPIGIHRFAVKKGNYKVQPQEVIANVTGSGTGELVMFELTEDVQSQPYQIHITTDPISGGIFIDNIYRGQGSVELTVDPGEYLVSFVAVDGYETPLSQKVTLTPNNRLATVTGTYQRRLEFSLFIDSLGTARQSGGLRMDLGYFIPAEGLTPDTLWGPAVKYVKDLRAYAWELGWGIATRNPTGYDYIRFQFDIPADFARTKPLTMMIYIFGSSKNYPLTVLNRAEVDMSFNGDLVWENHVPETMITQGLPDKYEELPIDRYVKSGANEIVIRVSAGSQCFVYLRGIEIR